jgi:hypothetical protein
VRYAHISGALASTSPPTSSSSLPRWRGARARRRGVGCGYRRGHRAGPRARPCRAGDAPARAPARLDADQRTRYAGRSLSLRHRLLTGHARARVAARRRESLRPPRPRPSSRCSRTGRCACRTRASACSPRSSAVGRRTGGSARSRAGLPTSCSTRRANAAGARPLPPQPPRPVHDRPASAGDREWGERAQDRGPHEEPRVRRGRHQDVPRGPRPRARLIPIAYEATDAERTALAEVFSRGFTTAYLDGIRDERLMGYDRPNNRGVPVGRVASVADRVATVAFDKAVETGDTLEFWTRRGRFGQKGGSAPGRGPGTAGRTGGLARGREGRQARCRW